MGHSEEAHGVYSWGEMDDRGHIKGRASRVFLHSGSGGGYSSSTSGHVDDGSRQAVDREWSGAPRTNEMGESRARMRRNQSRAAMRHGGQVADAGIQG